VLLIMDTAYVRGNFSHHGYELPPNPDASEFATLEGMEGEATGAARDKGVEGGGEGGGQGGVEGGGQVATGLNTFPAIFCFPAEKEPEKLKRRHWPTIVSLMCERSRRNFDINAVRTAGIVVHAEPKLNTTYLIYHVDIRMALVVMLDTKVTLCI
jgi:hypothetical protein